MSTSTRRSCTGSPSPPWSNKRGITLASRLLGHANEQITRASYVVSALEVDPITIDILDDILGP